MPFDMIHKNIFLLLLTCLSLPVLAQNEPAEGVRDPRGRERIRAAHAAYITQRLELTSAEAEKFWPLYREYAEKRGILRQQLRDARTKGTDEKTLLDLDLQIKQQELDLEKDYTERFQEVVTADKLVRLRQAEVDFRRLVLRQVQQRQRRRR